MGKETIGLAMAVERLEMLWRGLALQGNGKEERRGDKNGDGKAKESPGDAGQGQRNDSQ